MFAGSCDQICNENAGFASKSKYLLIVEQFHEAKKVDKIIFDNHLEILLFINKKCTPILLFSK